jgi:hypothetical protein
VNHSIASPLHHTPRLLPSIQPLPSLYFTSHPTTRVYTMSTDNACADDKPTRHGRAPPSTTPLFAQYEPSTAYHQWQRLTPSAHTRTCTHTTKTLAAREQRTRLLATPCATTHPENTNTPHDSTRFPPVNMQYSPDDGQAFDSSVEWVGRA